MNTKQTLDALSALGHDGRLAIFRLLVRHAPDGLNAGEIASALNFRANTLSANLTVLANAGLVSGEREGRHIRYRADLDAMRALMAFLLEDCCGGSADICRPILDEITCRC
ncbi:MULTISPECIES: ArsR/SmtB family transcription factor [Alphaproteobacteria]|uniref:Transcriptional regulator n=2 Tax=Alphaproteobacteria TaxID=28211 RepID=A0A512HCD5_9HYPH|nr:MULTISPECIES: metalloregulator ArsR/SmtB family transcription factor [Alphaproteobacteria]GEO83118.1 transcriptional regulator [Ciceribacter naphthalenivorans]GLR20486.1 transcriptional regulator [Ciceribacter naphthalenivorans]GLT03342.1 transcriptional regulator [Sphingomonas psychrolutea]